MCASDACPIGFVLAGFGSGEQLTSAWPLVEQTLVLSSVSHPPTPLLLPHPPLSHSPCSIPSLFTRLTYSFVCSRLCYQQINLGSCHVKVFQVLIDVLSAGSFFVCFFLPSLFFTQFLFAVDLEEVERCQRGLSPH